MEDEDDFDYSAQMEGGSNHYRSDDDGGVYVRASLIQK